MVSTQQRRKKMTLKNAASFSLNQSIESLREIVKNMRNKLYNPMQLQRKQAYDLETVLADWKIYPDHPLVDILRQIFHTRGRQEHTEDVERLRDALLLHIHQSAEIFEFEEELGYRTNPPSCSKIRAQEVIADWDLSDHQGRTLEYIYQSLFEYGDKEYDTLHDAASILFDHLMMLRKNNRA
jgi:hypothetical protein